MSNTRHLKRSGGSARTLLAPTLFTRLPPAVQEDLRQRAPRRKIRAGTILQQAGDKASGFWLIDVGTVQIGIFRTDGDFRVIATLEAGDSYGELALLGGSERVADAVARTAVEMLWIDGSRFEQAILDDKATMREMLKVMALELQEVIGYIAGFRGGSSQDRIASVLANSARHTEDGAILITHSELAALAGVTRSTVAKVLGDFEKLGAIERRYGVIEIRDLALLDSLS